MLIEWLYRTTLEISLLIGLVLLVRPVVRRMLGARVSYWLWFIPLIRAVLIDRPERPRVVFENVGIPSGEINIFPSPESLALSGSFSWETVWIVGLSIWVILRAISWIRFRKSLQAKSTPLELPLELSSLIPERLHRLKANFFVSDLPGAPFVTGLLHPGVYLPTDFFQRFSSHEQKWVIRHELMHAIRKDLWMQLAWELIRAVFWFNPIVHLASQALREDQEIACDENILRVSSAKDRYEYGKALIAGRGPTLVPTTMTFIGKHKERIEMIRRHKNSPTRNIIGLALCAMVCLFALTTAPQSLAQDGLDNPVTLRLQQIGFKEVVIMIAKFAGTNIVVSDQVYSGRVSLEAQDVPVRAVLEDLVECAGATLEQAGENLYMISPSPDNEPSDQCAYIELDDRDEFGVV